MNFADLKTRTKILIPMSGMALLFAVVIAVGTIRLNDLTQRYGEITSHSDPAMTMAVRAAKAASTAAREAYGLLSYDPNGAWAKEVQANYNSLKKTTDEQWDQAISLSPVTAEKYKTFKERFDAIYDATQAPVAIGVAIPALNTGSALKAAELDQMATALKQLEIIDRDVETFMADVLSYNMMIDGENRKTVDKLAQDARNATWLMVGLGLLAVLGGLSASLLVVNVSVASPLLRLGERMKALASGKLDVMVEGQERADEVGQMAKTVQVFKDAAIEKVRLEQEAAGARRTADEERARNEAARAQAAKQQAMVVESLAAGLDSLSAGELTFRLDAAFAAEYEKLRADFNAAMQKLQTTMKVIGGATGEIRSGTTEISQASDDLSRRTEQQAASLEETAAALDQITSTVRRTAEGAQHAHAVVSTAMTDAERSREVVRSAVDAMSDIENSARQIGQIIGVIDEIAFQTNLLALNAGVEAARAGDAGRGFAVVASEVRALAQRSAEAAREIKTLISASTQQVEQGVNLVSQTGEALQRIAAQVADINAVVTEIAASAQEQAVGLAQVNTAVNQMDQVTQQNAAMVEESTAASHSLAQETEELAKLMTQFRTGDAADAMRARRAAPTTSRGGSQMAMKSMSTHSRGGGALRKAETAPDSEGWEEF